MRDSESDEKFFRKVKTGCGIVLLLYLTLNLFACCGNLLLRLDSSFVRRLSATVRKIAKAGKTETPSSAAAGTRTPEDDSRSAVAKSADGAGTARASGGGSDGITIDDFESDLQKTSPRNATENEPTRTVQVAVPEPAPKAPPPPEPEKPVPAAPQFDPTKVFALIVANENYAAPSEGKVPNVPLARTDADAVRRHCVEKLGVPAGNCTVVKDFTRAKFRLKLDAFCRSVGRAAEPTLVFYYAGHGFPVKGGESASLLPVDVDPEIADEYAVPIKDVFKQLAATGAKRVLVFLDAAFSETFSTRGSRGVRLCRPPLAPEPNMVVFAAASGTQATHRTNDGAHGLFTDALLKNLPAAGGNVSFGELDEALRRDVGNASGNTQTPETFFGKEIPRDGKLR